MVSESNFLKRLQQQSATFDDATLEALANKGLLRRAKKDFQQGEIPEFLSETETTVKFRVADMIVTLPEKGLTFAYCTCPAVETCRHILIVCLWLAQAKEDKVTSSTFSLLTYTYSDLIKWAGKKTVRTSLELLAKGLVSEITEADPILIKFPELNIESRFFPSTGLEGMICSCKSRDVCRHLVAAVLAYQQAQGIVIDVLDNPLIFLSETSGSPRNRIEIIQACKMFLEETISIGLCHLSISIKERCTTLAVATQGVNLPRLSLELRRIVDDVDLNLNRDAKADTYRLFLSVARTYALCSALENIIENQGSNSNQTRVKELIGESRSQYHSVNVLELAGMGAYHWQTKSGYAGLTVLFWDLTAKKWCSWSDTRPLFKSRDFSPQALYYKLEIWQGLQSPQEASQSRFKLMAARRNSQNRLSSSKLSSANLIGLTEPQEIDFENCSFQNWHNLRVYASSILKTGLSEYDLLNEIVIIKPTAWGDKNFDDISQSFTWQIIDNQGDILPLRVSFQPVDEQRIKTLESLEPESIKVYGIVAQLMISSADISIYPISLLCPGNQKILNLSFPIKSDTGKMLSLSQDTGKMPMLQSEITDGEEVVEREEIDNFYALNLLGQKIDYLIDEIQYLAESGSSYIKEDMRQYLLKEAKMFSDLGLDVIASHLHSILNASGNVNYLLLKLRYLCQLCQEVAVKEHLS